MRYDVGMGSLLTDRLAVWARSSLLALSLLSSACGNEAPTSPPALATPPAESPALDVQGIVPDGTQGAVDLNPLGLVTQTQESTWRPGAKPPPGSGIWIWYFEYTGKTAAQIAQEAANNGVGFVLVKSGQDGSFWSKRYNAKMVKEFTSRGITVLAWPYITPKNISGAIDASVQALKVPGTSGLILDVEIEFEGNHASAAQTLCEGIRRGAPGSFVGYTSFGWVGYHSTFPYKTFDKYCGDAFLPQVYWSDRGISWSKGYQQAADQIRQTRLKAPVWMATSNDSGSKGAPSTADLSSFFLKSGLFTTLWEYPAKSAKTKHAQLAALPWGG
jgi:hypothetical protein